MNTPVGSWWSSYQVKIKIWKRPKAVRNTGVSVTIVEDGRKSMIQLIQNIFANVYKLGGLASMDGEPLFT